MSLYSPTKMLSLDDEPKNKNKRRSGGRTNKTSGGGACVSKSCSAARKSGANGITSSSIFGGTGATAGSSKTFGQGGKNRNYTEVDIPYRDGEGVEKNMLYTPNKPVTEQSSTYSPNETKEVDLNEGNTYSEVDRINNRAKESDMISDLDAENQRITELIDGGKTYQEATAMLGAEKVAYDEGKAADESSYRKTSSDQKGIKRSFMNDIDFQKEIMNDPAYKDALSMQLFGSTELGKGKQKVVEGAEDLMRRRLDYVKPSQVTRTPTTEKRKGVIGSYNNVTNSFKSDGDFGNNIALTTYALNQDSYKNSLTTKVDGLLKASKTDASSKDVIPQLRALKYKAVREGKYKYGEDFNINNIDSLKDSDEYQKLQKLYNLSDEEINGIMPSVADNNKQSLYSSTKTV